MVASLPPPTITTADSPSRSSWRPQYLSQCPNQVCITLSASSDIAFHFSGYNSSKLIPSMTPLVSPQFPYQQSLVFCRIWNVRLDIHNTRCKCCWGAPRKRHTNISSNINVPVFAVYISLKGTK
ncbi:hypothetical protein E2C01_033309 [Portunus trituberculatus]|uniref:Uncharacterized protein n=1 Tax=Portunus trituberculatus TaxID=210409 RepID=A0A5B7EXI8_PORTR|nr:hypothetical protein [Portunus trituberculatus]